jgi:hypothetical protein
VELVNFEERFKWLKWMLGAFVKDNYYKEMNLFFIKQTLDYSYYTQGLLFMLNIQS